MAPNVAVASTSMLAKQHLVQQQLAVLQPTLQPQQQQQQQIHQQQSMFDLSLLNDNNQKLQNALLRSEDAILGLNSGSTTTAQISAATVAQINQQQQQQHHHHLQQQQQAQHHLHHPVQAQGQGYVMGAGGAMTASGLRPSPPVATGAANILLNSNTNNRNVTGNNLLTTTLDHNNMVLGSAAGVVGAPGNIVMDNYVKTGNDNELSAATNSSTGGNTLDVGSVLGAMKPSNELNVPTNVANSLHLSLSERNDLYLGNKSWSTTADGTGSPQLPLKVTGGEMKDVMASGGNPMVVQVDKLVVENDENAGLGDILGGFGEGDDDEILKSLTAEIGDDFNILEYADPELDELNGETNLLSQMDFDDHQKTM